MDINKEQLELIDIQVIISWVIIGSIVVSLLIAENTKLKLDGKDPFWTEEEVKTIATWTRVIVLIIAFAAVYVNWKGVEILKESDASQNNINSGYLEVGASVLAVIAGIIILYAVINASAGSEEEFIDIENPEL